ncbi:carbonic anhydrase [Streptomyces sp. HU2014]|uniref:Carbonic anhydrase n=1 Tax=Streptomyces albireticuli TaxID=1940 RepID=A0A1Z2L1Q1_9ACTN|nr:MULTISPECIES: carbonic anhydrase [Streptomyces]ARZ68220.1 carbonic anhydrase [Streptomyces albireticuli]UQI48192.1 carbonic anhydrase [Streptomyces sp. HU2014]
MQSLIDHARAFPTRARQSTTGELSGLASGQSPEALFITCSDSRVVPTLITNTRPGDLFELRTAGNIVPEYSTDHPAGEMATIEYAVTVLGVQDIIVCGHSHCGAVGALVRDEDLTQVPAVRGWLERGASPALRDGEGDTPDVAIPVQRHALAQLDRLRAYPCVAERIDDGRLGLHAWYYEVHTGLVLAHQTVGDDALFLPL